VCVFFEVCAPSLLGLGGDQQPQGASYAEGLADHGLHLGEGPEEQQVLVDGVDLPAHLQASHLDGQTHRQGNTQWWLFLGYSSFSAPSKAAPPPFFFLHSKLSGGHHSLQCHSDTKTVCSI